MLIVVMMLVMSGSSRLQRLQNGAVLRRARPAAADIGELAQVVAKAGQFDDLLLHLGQLGVSYRFYLLTGDLGLVGIEVEQLADIGQRESHRLGANDELQPSLVLLTVETVAGFVTDPRRDEPVLLVKTQGICLDPARLGQFTDPVHALSPVGCMPPQKPEPTITPLPDDCQPRA